MSNILIESIISQDDLTRNCSINSLLKGRDSRELLRLASELEEFRQSSGNLYFKVRACLFLFVIYRFYLTDNKDFPLQGTIPFLAVKASMEREFEKSIAIYTGSNYLNSTIFSAMADAYYRLCFQYLLDQVKLSMSQCPENAAMYGIHSLVGYPFSVPEDMLIPDPDTGNYPVGMDCAPVRLDPSHSGWSDIFFLGMDFPEGARVINISADLRIHGTKDEILPPCECYCRYIEEPVIYLRSIDLSESKKISTLDELFNFGNDHLSLLKAGVVASGIIPPSLEMSGISLQEILQKLIRRTGGIEIITNVHGIPKGSRLAVSTTLLATIIAQLMRFSGQIKNACGTLSEQERRIVASRAILGEWLGGSGGGWQDSGGLWPGVKLITGRLAAEGDPEYGISRGCLMPEHKILGRDSLPADLEQKLLDSLVLVHGGISQDVGPILEMVTTKYLLRLDTEWEARKKGIEFFDQIVAAIYAGDIEELGRLTSLDWQESVQPIIPWVNNAFTDTLINSLKQEFGRHYWGFLMLGGMSGGGMAFIVAPDMKDVFKRRIGEIMLELKNMYNSSFPFIIDPVVYDFQINHAGISASVLKGENALILSCESVFNSIDESSSPAQSMKDQDIKNTYGFDSNSHEHIKAMLKSGEIGLARNRLPISTVIQDVSKDELSASPDKNAAKTGLAALNNNEAAIVSFAGGMGSRWSQGSAVVKSINPFVNIEGRYRTFIEIHLAKSNMSGKQYGHRVQHAFTTSYLTHQAIENYMEQFAYFESDDRIYLSPGRSIAHRVYPMERDLRFHWEEQLQQKMDSNVQKVLDSAHNALIDWCKVRGEGNDYGENTPLLRFNPPGHWYEVPNMLKNGTLAQMIKDNPGLKYLFCHNIDTMGAGLDPEILGRHINSGSCISFEVTPRRIEDAGGGLAWVNGHLRLVEGVALPREEDEYALSYYNTLSNWITIDDLLKYLGLNRNTILRSLDEPESMDAISVALLAIEKKIPTYVAIKNVKQVWGRGQEDIYPVAQFEKLWGDISGLIDVDY
ncbi:UTP--glucose-1-phosphate uridylyltransferase [bacterium]|nr:UTP--glucose-1-phosphate uridylyltransferase [bacterium]